MEAAEGTDFNYPKESKWTRLKRWLFVNIVLLLSLGWAKFKEVFPPNRLVLLLGGTTVAVSAWISAFLAANVPGVTFSSAQILAFVGGAELAVIILLYKWFDGWIKDQVMGPWSAVQKPSTVVPPINTTVVVKPPGTVEIHPDDAVVGEGKETPPLISQVDEGAEFVPGQPNSIT